MKLFIGICNSQREIPHQFFWSFMAIKKFYYCSMAWRSDHPWDVIRNNRIIDKFLKSDCDVLAKMDIDQIYPSEYFGRFMDLVKKYKVIGPLINDRWNQNNYMPLAFESYKGNEFKLFPIAGKTGIHKIPYSHTNLFYAREVLEKIPPPWYEAHMTKDGLDRANHVDYTFLDKIKQAGYPVYIDLDTKVGHKTVNYV